MKVNADNINFKDIIKFDLNEKKTKKEILSRIEETPGLIYGLSNERLKQLIQIQQENLEELFTKYSSL